MREKADVLKAMLPKLAAVSDWVVPFYDMFRIAQGASDTGNTTLISWFDLES